MALTWLDNVFIAIIIVSIVVSFIRGFVKEALSLVVWFLAFVIAARFSTPLSDLFASHIDNISLRIGLSFLLLFVVTLIAGGFINFMLSELVIKTGLGGTNRLLGVVFGLLRGVIIVALLLLLAQLTSIPKSDAWQKSLLIPKIQPIAAWLKDFIPAKTSDYFKFYNSAQHSLSKQSDAVSAAITQQINNKKGS